APGSVTQAAASAARLGRRRQNPSTWSLRRRLLVVVALLFAVLTTAVAIASVMTMRVVLESRVDEQLYEVAAQTARDVEQSGTARVDFPNGGSGTLYAIERDGMLVDGLVLTRVTQQGLADADGAVVLTASSGVASTVS